MQELKMRESLYKQSSNLDRVNNQNTTLHLDEYIRKQMSFFTKHIDKLNDDKMKQIAYDEQYRHLTSEEFNNLTSRSSLKQSLHPEAQKNMEALNDG